MHLTETFTLPDDVLMEPVSEDWPLVYLKAASSVP